MNVKLKSHHWIQIALAVAAASFVALSKQPELASTSAMFLALAGMLQSLSTTLGLTSESVVQSPSSPSSPPNLSDKRGVIGVRLLAVLTFLGCAGAACGVFGAAAPSVATLGSCVYGYINEHPGLNFESYVIGAALQCGVDVLDVLKAIVDSTDPNVAQFKTQAQAAQNDPVKIQALRGRLAARRAALAPDGGGR